MKPKGLFLNTQKANCSIYESGKMCYECLMLSDMYFLDYKEVHINDRKINTNYDFYIFNYHISAMGWLNTKYIKKIPGLKFTLVLEVAPNNPFVMCPENDFDAYIVLDPTLKHHKKNVYAFPRPLDISKKPISEYKSLDVPQIGSFGFGTLGKGFDLVIDAVNKEFESAIIKINIPKGNYVPAEIHNNLIQKLKNHPTKKNVKVEITSHYYSKDELVNWCSKNTINVFLYNRHMPGLSATTDQAIISERPLAVSFNETFRHITEYIPPYPEWSLQDFIQKSIPIIQQIKRNWAPINFAKKFESVLSENLLSKILKEKKAKKYILPKKSNFIPKTLSKLKYIVHKIIKLSFMILKLLINNVLFSIKLKGNIILFINHKGKECGVYQFGKNTAQALAKSNKFKIKYCECIGQYELQKLIISEKPRCVIYNYYPSTMNWLMNNELNLYPIPQVAIIHESFNHITEALGFRAIMFDYYIAPDPTLLLSNNIVFKTGRLVPTYKNAFPIPKVPTIGSFGFGTPDKGFEKIVLQVQDEFDEANIRFNIPFAEVDQNGRWAKALAERCKNLLTKKTINLEITHNFLDEKELLDFLAQNTVNVFLYEGIQDMNRGISSVIDFALAVERPIAISSSNMFRHTKDISPSIIIPNTTIKQIIANGFGNLLKYKKEFSEKSLIWDYERILVKIFNSYSPKIKLINTLKAIKSRILKNKKSNNFQLNSWLRNDKTLYEDNYITIAQTEYNPVSLTTNYSLNRILDNNASVMYKPAIDKLLELVPKTMSKKIPAANINQGFVFDTVYRSIQKYKTPKTLCVGSYEDTACMSLIKMGYNIEEIDPVVNYTLQEFFTNPSTQIGSYDIIFSTSVIEHDPDDKSFIECIENLLAPNGIFIMTCDFKDNWRQGASKPKVNARLYTQFDLNTRILSYMKDCILADAPAWQCSNYDFEYEGVKYTFASFVVRKEL